MWEVRDLACPVKEANVLQERHLRDLLDSARSVLRKGAAEGITCGLPSFPMIMPLGNFLGGWGAGVSIVAVVTD